MPSTAVSSYYAMTFAHLLLPNLPNTQGGDREQCANECHDRRCTGFFYRSEDRQCHLNNVYVTEDDPALMNMTGISYYARDIKDCSDLPPSGDGIFTIQPDDDMDTIQVYCDMTRDGGGWTVLQRRTDGSVDFKRNWTDYRDGFGNLTNEFWLGNSAIYRLTNQQPYKLHIHLTDVAGEEAYAEYSTFYIQGEDNKFRLMIDGYSGTAGDSLIHYHDTMYFSTYDNDNDAGGANCAVNMPGGWWYKTCLYANLNGQFGVNTYSSGINWESWRGWGESLVGSVMKIKPL